MENSIDRKSVKFRAKYSFFLIRSVFLVTLCLNLFLGLSHCSTHTAPEPQDGKPQDYHHHLFSRAQRIQARVTREVVHSTVRGSQRHQQREKREIPLSSTIHPDGGHVEKITVTLPLDGKSHVLDLQLNRDLIPKGYFERTQRENKTVVHRPSYEEVDVCHYHGKIRGHPQSWAALSTCDDVIRGAVFDGDQLHYIEPVSSSSSSKDSANKGEDESKDPLSWDLIHLKHAQLTRNLSCGHADHAHDDGHPISLTDSLYGGLKNNVLASSSEILGSSGEKGILKRVKRGYSSHEDTRVPYNSNAKSRYVELVIVVDNKKYKELGGDLKAVRRRTKDIASIVNSLYAPLNIFIALVGMVVWSESDEITIKANGDETLASFLHYRKERLLRDHPNDNAQLLTAVEFENGVVGKAMQGPICSYKYSGGVNSDFKNNVIGVVATTVAHELGHNFGLSHDTESCTCPSSNNRCIMAASASSNRTMHWSSCSLKDFAYAFDHGMDYCLRNKPDSLYDGPTCGNGFTEPGEECDCGLAEHCENPCCDANTCMIHLNATCASGTCCDMETCHVKAGGTMCREANKLCDLPEYCTGESEFCPEDVSKMDGLTCDTPSGQAYCFNGECRTHTDQCRLLWGPSGNNSNDLCYQKNANGSRHAHCGYNLTTERYARCQSEDVKCGILHCQMNSEKLEFGYESVSILASFFVNAGGKIHPCRSVIVDFGLGDINPGMVPDGAKCGEDKMCVNQKCVPVGSILGSAVPVCDHDCSGQGVCNSKGHCHCDDGYGGTYCEASGYGGSIDSGPARDPYGTSRFFKILYVTFLGFIPLIAIITFYIYYAGDYFKKLCYSVITLQAFNSTNRSSRYNNKPSSNGTAGGGTGLRSRDISSPTSQNHSNPTSPPGGSAAGPGTGGEDFFGQYKGFSLSPIKSSPVNQQRSGGGSTSSPTGSNSHNNNNNEPMSQSSLPNGSIQSETNANVFYSSVPKQTETLVGNSDRPNGFRLPNGQTSFLQGAAGGNRSVTRVSWAQPIASPLPVSPGSEDESANSDTPLYENTGVEKGSPKIQKLTQPSPVIPGTHQQPSKNRPTSSTDSIDEMKRFYGGGKGNKSGEPQSPPVKKESPFGSTSAFSRFAAAIPFVRSSFRLASASSSTEDNSKAGAKGKNLPKKGSRGNLEISKPILQSDAGGADQVDSSPRYANVPVDEPTKKPALKNVDRVRAHSPPPVGSKPIPKVQRAHSMIQPSSSSNRNSIHGSNGNYNSLRRARPSVPPPKPPEAPPPPPPTYMSSFSEAKSKFLTQQQSLKNASSPSPPPVPPPNAAVTAPVLPAEPSPKGLRNSIGKFTFGANRSRSSSPSATPATKPAPILSTTPPSTSLFKAPIAKVEELNSPSSPPSNINKKSVTAEPRQENIYDTIDEGMVALALNNCSVKKITPPTGLPLKKKSCDGGSSSGDSSPTAKKSSRRGSEEKIETLSTGSSESNNGGLLSEIILEIQQRNKESIYNSVDRRKQRREKKAAAANSTLMAERTKPEITTPKPTISTLSSMSKLSSSPASKTSSPNSRESTPPKSSFSPNSSRRYVSPLSNQSFSFYKKPTGPGSGPPPGSPSPATTTAAPTLPVNSTVVDAGTSGSNTSKPKVVLNPTVVSPPPPPSSSNTLSSRPQSTSSLFSNLSSPRVSFSSTFSRSSVSPPVITTTPSSASKAPPVPAHASPPVPAHGTPMNSSSAAKPTCAVNGVPKTPVASSPSYVAKINYFSNLSQAAANTPMKPVNSIPAPFKGNAAKEIIYAPSNVDLSGNDGCHPGDRSHYAATIRRSRPQYYNNKDLEGDLNDANSNPVTDYNAANKNKQGTLGRKPMGIYGSLGRKVATPVIRSNSIEKEKREARSRESTPETTISSSGSNGGSSDRIDREAVVATPSSTASSISGSSPQIGYKPFNPYLNRQLTFSTFRPSTGGGGGAKNSPDNKTNNSTTASTNGSGAIAANGKCAVSSKPASNGVGVTSPVQLRSPNRLVK